MTTAIINIHQAKTNLSRLVEEVALGSEIIIAKAGRPVAKLTPLATKKQAIRFDLLKGKVKIASDFNAPLPPEIIRAFTGK
jgi:prevent-host-death family protein